MNAVAMTRRVEIAVDHPAFAGHFPNQPVLPGVSLVAEVLEAARAQPRLAACVGEAPRLPVLKFLAPVRPGATLDIEFTLGTRMLDWRVAEGDRLVASGQIARADIAPASSP